MDKNIHFQKSALKTLQIRILFCINHLNNNSTAQNNQTCNNSKEKKTEKLVIGLLYELFD